MPIKIPVKLKRGKLTELSIGRLHNKKVGPYDMKERAVDSRRDALQVAVNKLRRREGYHCRKAYNNVVYMLNIQAVFRKNDKKEQTTYKRLTLDIKWLQTERDRVCPYVPGYTLKKR